MSLECLNSFYLLGESGENWEQLKVQSSEFIMYSLNEYSIIYQKDIYIPVK